MCIFCLEKKSNEKEHGETSPYSKTETQLKKFIEIYLTYIELGRLGNGTGIAKTVETHNVVYHKKCYNKIDKKKEHNRLLARVEKKPCSEANSSSSTVIPHKRIKTEFETELGIFCGKCNSTENLPAAGEFHW